MKNKGFTLTELLIVGAIASQKAIHQRNNPQYLKTIGSTFYEMGRLEDSLKAYRYAVQRRHDLAV